MTAGHGPFVGREREFAILAAEVRRALKGGGGAILLSGEPGIGKTRTAEELGIVARGDGAWVLCSRGWEGGGVPAFWPWIQIVREFLRHEDKDEIVSRIRPSGRDIVQLMPELRELVQESLCLPIIDRYIETDEVRFKVFDSICNLIRILSEAVPLVMILDDLHWADTPSLVLLEHLSREISGNSLALIGTYRDNEVDIEHPLSRTLGALIRYASGTHMVLHGLGRQETIEFLELAVTGGVSSSLADAVVDKTEGNPFFIAEVAKLLATEKSLAAEWSGSSNLRIPATVRDVVRRRLSSLSEKSQDILRIGCVLGREFDASLLECVAGVPSDEVLRALDEARAAKIVAEVSGDLHRYRFTHVLVADTLYEDLPRSRRVQLHASVGLRFEEAFADEVDAHLPLLAHHFCRGVPIVDRARAAGYARRAGWASRQSLAYEEAVSYFLKALELLPLDANVASERCETMLALGESQARAGDWLAARKTYGLAAGLARKLGEYDSFAKAAAGFKGLIPGKNPPDEQAIAMLREALSLLGPRGSAVRARTLGELAKALYFSSERKEATRASIEAVDIARGLGEPTALGNALEARLYALWRPADLNEILEVSSELMSVSAKSDRELHCRVLLFRYACLLELGDRARSKTNLDYANALSNELKNPRYRWQVKLALSAEALSNGDFVGSKALSEDALRLGTRVHDSSAEHYKILNDFTSQRLSGHYSGQLEASIAIAVEAYPQIVVYQVGLAAVRKSREGVDANHLGPIDSLARSVEDNALYLFTVAVLVDVLGMSECKAATQVLYEAMSPYARHNIVVSWGAACDGSVSHYLGVLASMMGRMDDAGRHFEDALEMNRRMNFVPFVARTQHYYAAMLLERDRRDDRERAVKMLSEAITTYRRVGMMGYLRDALEVASGVSELSDLCEAPIEDGINREQIEVSDGQIADDDISVSTTTEESLARSHERAEQNLFRREGEYWTVCYRGRVLRLKNMRGLEYIAHLLGQPGKEVHALDLSTLVQHGSKGSVVRECAASVGNEDGLRVARLGDAGPVLDSKSRSKYRVRLGALSREVAEAERLNDVLKAAAARREMEMLARELSAGTRRGGGPRLAGSYAERARVNVRNNISTALRAIRRHDEELWRHLYRGVRTGTFCAYIPEAGVDWQL